MKKMYVLGVYVITHSLILALSDDILPLNDAFAPIRTMTNIPHLSRLYVIIQLYLRIIYHIKKFKFAVIPCYLSLLEWINFHGADA